MPSHPPLIPKSGTGQQLREAFPFDQLPRNLLRDRDAIFGGEFRRQVTHMGIHEVLSTWGSPWQRTYVERLIGSVRRECLDQVIVFSESSLRRILASYFQYYHRSRTHLSLGKDSPEPRSIQPAAAESEQLCMASMFSPKNMAKKLPAAFVVAADVSIIWEHWFTPEELDSDPEASWPPEGC